MAAGRLAEICSAGFVFSCSQTNNPTTQQADREQIQQPPWRDKGLFYFVRSDPGLKELLSSEGLLTRSSAAPLLNQTQRYPLGVDHKYEEVSVHMLPHDKTCTQPHNDL